MNIEKYIGNIKPLPKADLLATLRTEKTFIESIGSTFDGLSANNINLDVFANNWAVTKSVLTSLHKTQNAKSTLIEIVKFNLDSINKCLDLLVDRINKTDSGVFTKETITIYEANLLNLAENISFWSKFTNIMLDTLVVMVLNDESGGSVINKADLNFVNKTWAYYADINKLFAEGPSQVFKNIDAVLDVQATTDNIDTVVGSKGSSGVNGFTREFAPHHVNPLYWIATVRASYDIYRLNGMEDSNTLMAMKLTQINNKRNGTNDVSLDYQMEVYQNKIIKNKAKQEQIRDRYS